MSVTERLMSTGGWSLKLRAEAPQHVLSQLNLRKYGFGHICVMPSHLPLVDIDAMTDSELRAICSWMGVYRSRDTEYQISGPGLAFWLGDEDGKGSVYQSFVNGGGSGSIQNYRDNLTPPGFSAQGGLASPGGLLEKTFRRVTRRDVLPEVCAHWGVEWKVDTNFKFWLGTTSELFRTTPRAAIVRHSADAADEGTILALPGEYEIEQDLEDWTREVYYYTGTEDTPTLNTNSGGVAAADVPYRGPDGTAIAMTRVIEDFNDTSSAYGSTLAAAQYGRFNRVRENMSVVSTGYDIYGRIEPGDYVWLYDPDRDLYNIANEFPFRGTTIYPIKMRATGITWPFHEGLGVYFRRWVDNNTTTWDVEWVDLTEWVEWENDTTQVELGDLPRPTSWAAHQWRDRRDVQSQPRYLSSITL